MYVARQRPTSWHRSSEYAMEKRGELLLPIFVM